MGDGVESCSSQRIKAVKLGVVVKVLEMVVVEVEELQLVMVKVLGMLEVVEVLEMVKVLEMVVEVLEMV